MEYNEKKNFYMARSYSEPTVSDYGSWIKKSSCAIRSQIDHIWLKMFKKIIQTDEQNYGPTTRVNDFNIEYSF
jgi:hypothetical protein